jgi:hypothetical protein
MTIGPVSYTVIAFPGNQFNGNVAPEVAKLVADGTVRIRPDGRVGGFQRHRR